MNEKNKPELIIGGANGSGKTTFAREVVAQTGIEYLGADEIAAELNPAAPETVAIEAARMFSRRFDEYINSGESVLVESTLSGFSLRKFLRAAKENDFRVRLNGSVSEETLREKIEFQRIGNRAVHIAQEENRRLGIPNWYSINGKIVSDQEISNGVPQKNSADSVDAVPKI